MDRSADNPWGLQRTDRAEPNPEPCGCFTLPCPEPTKHPVHKASQKQLGKFLVICTHPCPADVHGQAHYITEEMRLAVK